MNLDLFLHYFDFQFVYPYNYSMQNQILLSHLLLNFLIIDSKFLAFFFAQPLITVDVLILLIPFFTIFQFNIAILEILNFEFPFL